MGRSGAGRVRMILPGILIIAAGVLPLVVTSSYHMHLIIMTCINIMLGLSFSVLYSAGLLTMATASFWAVGAYASALLVMKLGWSFWIALPTAGSITALTALAIGSVIVRVPGVAFLVQTLVLSMIVPEILGYFEFLGSWAGILGIPEPDRLGPIIFIRKIPNYYLILLLLFINVLVFQALYRSRVGRAWRSIRLNPNLAQTLGINLYRYRLLALIVSSVSAGVAGSFYAHYFQTLEPGMFSAFKSINVQIFSILGGLEFTILGPVLGAAIMTFVPEWLRLSKEIEPIITGTVLILLVIFLPRGILSIPDRVRYLFFKTTGKVKPEELLVPTGTDEGGR